MTSLDLKRSLFICILWGMLSPFTVAADNQGLHFLTIPRKTGATLDLTIDMNNLQDNEDHKGGLDGKSTPYLTRLDYHMKGEDIDVRLKVLNGKMSGQGLLLKLRKDQRRNEYYRFHPLFGLDAVSKAAINKQLGSMDMHIDDLLNMLNPVHAGPLELWKSRSAKPGFIIQSPPNTFGCRDEYRLLDANQELPQQIKLCRESRTHQQTLKITESLTLDKWRFPKRILYQQDATVLGKIVVSVVKKQLWKNASRFDKEALK